MLRGIRIASAMVQLCGKASCCAQRAPSLLASRITPIIGNHLLHTSQTHNILDRDLKGKKRLLKMSVDEKMDDGSKGPEHMSEDLTGVAVEGMVCPTLETHAMLVNGVRYDELPIVHIHSSTNNTLMVLTDHTGATTIDKTSCGMEGFQNVKKSTGVAAQATGLSLGYKAKRKGVTHVRVAVGGLGAGRLPAIKGLQMAGMTIISLTDTTKIFNIGPRPRKQRRV